MAHRITYTRGLYVFFVRAWVTDFERVSMSDYTTAHSHEEAKRNMMFRLSEKFGVAMTETSATSHVERFVKNEPMFAPRPAQMALHF